MNDEPAKTIAMGGDVGVLLDITDPEQVGHELNRLYSFQRLSFADDRCHLRLELDQLGPVRLDRVHVGMSYESTSTPLGSLIAGRVREGRLAYETRDRSDTFTSGDAFLSPRPDEDFHASVSDLEAEYVTIPPALIDDVTDVRAPVRFSGYEPVSAVAAGLWTDTLEYAQQVAALEVGREPLVAGGVARLLAAAALSAFPNTALAEVRPRSADRNDAHPAALRRALAFIEANAHRDISPAEVARASYVSIRAVQLAFRRHLDTTPMGYVRRVRLEQVHRELLAADPSRVTVAAVAARWGFPHHGRFAAYYRESYGCPPSRTLHH